MSNELRPLILRSNRFLGSALLERDLISNEVLEKANEKLLDLIQKGEMRSASLLNVLLFDLKGLNEAKMIDAILEAGGVGAIDLDNYDISAGMSVKVDMDLCFATYTFPFDKLEDFTMVATAYYLSKPAMAYWQDQLGEKIAWYVCSVASIVGALERTKAKAEEAAKAEAEKAQKLAEAKAKAAAKKA